MEPSSLPPLIAKEKQKAVTKITLAFEDQDYPPWVLKNGSSGLDIFLLKKVDENLPSVEFHMRPVPWKRCLTDLESNLHQGCFSASYSEHRKKLGVYPTSHGVVDPSKRLHIDSYSIFVHQDETKVEVRDGTIKGLDLKKDQICVQSDYSIISDLRTMGFKVTDTLRSTDACFNLLINKRVRAVATLTDKGLFIAKNKEYAGKIKVLPNALLQKPYYLIFSYDFFLESPEMVRSIFLEIEKIRESPEYKEELANVLKNRSPSSFVDEY